MLTQEQLGARLGEVPQTTVSRWEKALVDLKLHQLRDLEVALELTPGHFAAVGSYLHPSISQRLEPMSTFYFDRLDDLVDHLRAADLLGVGLRLRNRLVEVDGAGLETEEWVMDLYEPGALDVERPGM